MTNLGEGPGAQTVRAPSQRQPDAEPAVRPKVTPIQVPAPKNKKDDRPQYEFSTESDICTSPSWSDFGGNSEKRERKKAEKERKELEKKLKKEKEREGKACKQGKRLSKLPPTTRFGKDNASVHTEERSSMSSERPTEPHIWFASPKTSLDLSIPTRSSKEFPRNSSASSLEPGLQKSLRQVSPSRFCEPTPPSTRPSSSVDTSPTLQCMGSQEPNPPHHQRHAFHQPSVFSRPSLAGSRSMWAAGKRTSDQQGGPLGKCFFICCGCLRWHDLPADIFEKIFTKTTPQKKMMISDPVSNTSTTTATAMMATMTTMAAMQRMESSSQSNGKQKAVMGTVSSTYPCPWCKHEMSSDCCAAWTTVIYVHTRHH
ncbi:hypothetical protein GP486_006941 [Trichoglossum hirsutum]|uniref:Uncharacterized protein n=1 Tax=Trichoglossum hirsutum TaxID=265104 RepID=A0A9P8II45_9PEZI|nr:hypothetical protein GP486_006941 [Trichoglossum hirsutum]